MILFFNHHCYYCCGNYCHNYNYYALCIIIIIEYHIKLLYNDYLKPKQDSMQMFGEESWHLCCIYLSSSVWLLRGQLCVLTDHMTPCGNESDALVCAYCMYRWPNYSQLMPQCQVQRSSPLMFRWTMLSSSMCHRINGPYYYIYL